MRESASGPHGLFYSPLHSDLGRQGPNLLFLFESASYRISGTGVQVEKQQDKGWRLNFGAPKESKTG